ncbi:MarR family winged helix-turn-helix transcriptional regulator [Phytoactinopolyspora halotolerans]|uniref:MarR family transcriptional regulator n=1 Tax=Phytoactinopolyspora halotolerans TaxID=1981512 RepID=A0A6L9S605_9ACTN|nr:MarR family transcriptional regulator [Phytoactinopolyspora halotolerans]NED99941.1 MarR family transcriptional regulator [Phytoactinopolyspora halotolerans]
MREVTELRYLILALQREGNRQLATDLRPLGLTPSQAETLGLLAEREPLTLNGLGEMLVCESGTNPSRIVDRLVSAGLVRRVPNPEDRRQVLLTLTDHGRELARQVVEVEQRLEDRLVALIGDRPVAPALTLLRDMAAQVPAGRALDRRRG